jgi:hypothetical protein
MGPHDHNSSTHLTLNPSIITALAAYLAVNISYGLPLSANCMSYIL